MQPLNQLLHLFLDQQKLPCHGKAGDDMDEIAAGTVTVKKDDQVSTDQMVMKSPAITGPRTRPMAPK